MFPALKWFAMARKISFNLNPIERIGTITFQGIPEPPFLDIPVKIS
jgi:hypothetical protein